jgi:signal transduction histidine kinase/CheY-like chemotaxis protein
VAKVFAELASPGTNRFENDWLTRDGRRRRITWSNVAMQDEHGNVDAILGTGIDITDQLLLESRLAQADRLDSISRLASGVAHDFNNNLTSLCLRVDRLNSRNLDPDSRADLDAITNMIDRAQGLITELLSFSRPHRPTPVPLDVNAEIERLDRQLESIVGGAIDRVLDLSRSPAVVLIDRIGFEQILSNLVVNARDAMPTGGTLTIATALEQIDPDAAPSVRVPERLPPGRYVRVTVEDTGTGIHAGDLTRVFDPYFTTKPAGRGTGLGLATTYATVTRNAGAITADSEPGLGAAFHIWLPLATDQSRSSMVGATPATDEENGGHLALVVDDDPEARETLADELARLGCETIPVATGGEALAHLDTPIDLLLTDLELPDIGGDEVARRFLRHRPDLWVVYASGAPVVRTRALLPDDAVVLRKPFTTADLVAAVRDHRWAYDGGAATVSPGQPDGANR